MTASTRAERKLIDLRHPVVVRFNAGRAADLLLRLADQITAFAGSTKFVYIHAVGLMIGQNRQAAFREAKADHDFTEQELRRSMELTQGVRRLTLEVHGVVVHSNAAAATLAD